MLGCGRSTNRKRVGPEVVEVADVIGAIEQRVDQFLSLVGIGRLQEARSPR